MISPLVRTLLQDLRQLEAQLLKLGTSQAVTVCGGAVRMPPVTMASFSIKLEPSSHEVFPDKETRTRHPYVVSVHPAESLPSTRMTDER